MASNDRVVFFLAEAGYLIVDVGEVRAVWRTQDDHSTTITLKDTRAWRVKETVAEVMSALGIVENPKHREVGKVAGVDDRAVEERRRAR